VLSALDLKMPAPFYMESAQAFLDQAPRVLMRGEDGGQQQHQHQQQQRHPKQPQKPLWKPVGSGTRVAGTSETAQRVSQVVTRGMSEPVRYAGERLSTVQAKEVHREASKVARATRALHEEIKEFSEDLRVTRAVFRAQIAMIRENLVD